MLESNINGYTVEEQIAESDSARVLRVRKNGQTFAMKLPKEERAQQLLAEGAVQQKLSHPHIARLLDLHREPTYLLFELYPKTVRDKLERKLDPYEAIDITVQVLEGLAYLHEQGVAHKDLKPENLLLAGDGRVVIADFGIANTGVHNTNVSGKPEGTDAYRAPEQRTGPGDQRSDMYSLGIILYELLTGQRPIPLYTPASERCSSPKELDTFIEKCFSEKPHERPTANEALNILATIPLRNTAVLRAKNTALETQNLDLRNINSALKREVGSRYRFRTVLAAATAGFLLGAGIRDCTERIHTRTESTEYWYQITLENGEYVLNFPVGLDKTAGPTRPYLIEESARTPLRIIIDLAQANDEKYHRIRNENGEERATYTPRHIEDVLKALGPKIIREKCETTYNRLFQSEGGFSEITGRELPTTANSAGQQR